MFSNFADIQFLGDPFGLEVTPDNLILSIASASAPEPASWMLSVVGLVCIAVVLGRRRGVLGQLRGPGR